VPGGGEVRTVCAPGLRESEIEHLDLPVGADLHIGRFQIAVDDALLVRGFERVGDLARDRDRIGHRNRPALKPHRQVFSRGQLHGQETNRAVRCARRLLEREQRRDVRVRQRGEQPGLPLQTGEAVRVRGEHRREHFESDLPAEPAILRAIHFAHSASGQQRHDV
jgi:hypothetical protein